MNAPIDLDELVIDGQKLRQAREARGLSLAEVAALVTLSREQVQQIEDGGNRPFYTPAHKLLAIRKYAAAMDIPYDDIVSGPGASETMPVPDHTPPQLMVHSEGEEATDLRLAAVERNAEIRRRILIVAVCITILLAIYAKLRGTPGDEDPQAQADTVIETKVAASPAPEERAPAAAPSAATATATRLAAEPTAAPAQATASTPQAPATSGPSPISSAVAAQTPPSAPVPTSSATAGTAVAIPSTAASAAADESCGPPTGDVKTWSPIYQRKADTRLFIISPKSTTVCVVDASGKSALLQLKPMAGQAFTGKPPYVVKSGQLAEMEMYLQGMRVRVPPQTPVLKLQPTQVTAPPSSQSEAGPDA